MRNVIVILGPTASGKSALGVSLAKKFGGVVISADSRQVYRGMDIGAGKITKKEMSGVPHYLLDVASPRSQYSVARYARDFQRVVKKILSDTPIFLVGGSPFYIKAVTEEGTFSDVPLNPRLRRRLAAWPTDRLIKKLGKLDPVRLKTIDTANRRRLIRAIEIASYDPPPARGGVAQRAGEVGVPALPSMKILKIGIAVPHQKLLQKIDRRVDQRLRQGMIAEVRTLHELGLSWSRLYSFGLEYRFISRYLRGQSTKKEMADQLKAASHGFAKRQLTWWKREQDIRWVTKKTQAERLVRSFVLTR